jgi:hypothetical protein
MKKILLIVGLLAIFATFSFGVISEVQADAVACPEAVEAPVWVLTQGIRALVENSGNVFYRTGGPDETGHWALEPVPETEDGKLAIPLHDDGEGRCYIYPLYNQNGTALATAIPSHASANARTYEAISALPAELNGEVTERAMALTMIGESQFIGEIDTLGVGLSLPAYNRFAFFFGWVEDSPFALVGSTVNGTTWIWFEGRFFLYSGILCKPRVLTLPYNTYPASLTSTWGALYFRDTEETVTVLCITQDDFWVPSEFIDWSPEQ